MHTLYRVMYNKWTARGEQVEAGNKYYEPLTSQN